MASTVLLHPTSTPFVQLTRPWFWPLGWAPLWFGTVVATGSWVPDLEDVPTFVAALVVMGPLVWGSVCSINDLHDVDTDRLNPRKVGSPLVSGDSHHDDVARWHALFSIAALAVALVVGPMFALGTAGVLALGWAYSVPPVRLKSRPGLDILANAIPVGVLGPVAGWSLHRPVTEYPLTLMVIGTAVAAALYLPTLVIDRVPDRMAGVHTFAVRWGVSTSYRFGVLLWAVATVAWIGGLATGSLGPRQANWFSTGTTLGVLLLYAVLTRRPSITRMAVICLAFCLPAAQFLLGIHHQIGV